MVIPSFSRLRLQLFQTSCNPSAVQLCPVTVQLFVVIDFLSATVEPRLDVVVGV